MANDNVCADRNFDMGHLRLGLVALPPNVGRVSRRVLFGHDLGHRRRGRGVARRLSLGVVVPASCLIRAALDAYTGLSTGQ